MGATNLNMIRTQSPQMRRAQVRTVLAIGLWLALLPGCVAYMHETAEYADVQVDLKSKAEVLERYGKPVRKASEGIYEAWYYFLQRIGLAGPSVEETTNGVMLLLVPLWSTTKYEENTKFLFSGDTLVTASERVKKGSSFLCGIQAAHGVSPFCGGGDTDK